MPFTKEEKETIVGKWQKRSMDLIASQKTLVLATSADNHPWAAPVYYVYLKKFPFSRKVLGEKGIGAMNISTKVTLYAFYTHEMYYRNNLLGFGSRFALNV